MPQWFLCPIFYGIHSVYNNDTLCILQGVLKTRAHAPPVGKWADLEHLLWDLEPNPGPFLGRFKQWTNSQCPRNTKDWVILLLHFHGSYSPVEVQIPSHLQSLAMSLNDVIEAVELGRMSAANAKHLCPEVHASKNVCQEGNLGALPWAYVHYHTRREVRNRSSEEKDKKLQV